MGAEVKNFVPEAPAQLRQPEKMRVSEVQRLAALGLTVLICKDKSGAQRAMVVRDHAKPDNYHEINTAFQKVRNSRALRAAFAVAGGAVALAGCMADNSNTNISGTGLGQKSSAMNMGDMGNLGAPQMAAWTQFGDNRPNIGVVDGKTVLLLNRNDSVSYVDCDDIEDCLGAPIVKDVMDLPTGFGGYLTGGVYINASEELKMLFGADGLGTLGEMSLQKNATGTLQVSSSAYQHEPEASGVQFTVNNASARPTLVYMGTDVYAKLRNLHDLSEREIQLQQIFMNQCGTPDFSSGAAVASFLESEWGTEPVVCKLITAPTLDELADELLTTESFVASQNDYRSTPRLTNPRLVGKYLIYARYDRNPDTGQMEPRIWYAVVQDYCGDAVCNGTEDTATCEGDCPPVCGDVLCEAGETTATCATDCPPPDPCGDGACDPAVGETTTTCATDCPPTGDDDTADDDVTDDDATDDDIVDPCGDLTCDPAAGETTATCAGDCPTIGDDDVTDDDATDDDTTDDDATDDDVVDPCGDLTCDPAAGETPETCATDCPPTGDDDATDDDATDDDVTGDDDLSGDDDDIVADPCAFAEARVRELTAGCTKECADPIVTLDGTCVVEMGETPNISQIALTDAIYSIDVEEGSAYLIGGGSVSITDSGYELDTVYGDFVVGVTGTEYEMNLDEANNKLTISVAEGSVDVFYKGNKVATLEALPEIPAVMEFDTESGEILEPPTEEIPGSCPEAPQKCVPDLPDPNPKGCGGCDTNTPQTAGLWALMLAAIANTRRSFRRQKIS